MKPRRRQAADGTVYWQARWYEPRTRKTKGKWFRTKRDAERFAAKMQVALVEGTYVDPLLGKMTLEAWWTRFLESQPHLAPNSRRHYDIMARRHILPEFGGARVADLSRLDVEAWVGRLQAADMGVPTIHSAYKALRRALNAAEHAGVIGRNPARGVKIPRLQRREMAILTPEHVEDVADAIQPDRYGALVLFLLTRRRMRLRFSSRRARASPIRRPVHPVVEAYAAVGATDILGPTKNHQSRVVTLPGFLIDELAHYLEQYPPSEGRVFSNSSGRVVDRGVFAKCFRSACRKVGITRVRVHDLRHTAVALAIRAGAHPKEIQARAGHSSITVTMDTYGHLFPGQDEALAAALDELRPSQSATSRPREAGKVVNMPSELRK